MSRALRGTMILYGPGRVPRAISMFQSILHSRLPVCRHSETMVRSLQQLAGPSIIAHLEVGPSVWRCRNPEPELARQQHRRHDDEQTERRMTPLTWMSDCRTRSPDCTLRGTTLSRTSEPSLFETISLA